MRCFCFLIFLLAFFVFSFWAFFFSLLFVFAKPFEQIKRTERGALTYSSASQWQCYGRIPNKRYETLTYACTQPVNMIFLLFESFIPTLKKKSAQFLVKEKHGKQNTSNNNNNNMKNIFTPHFVVQRLQHSVSYYSFFTKPFSLSIFQK